MTHDESIGFFSASLIKLPEPVAREELAKVVRRVLDGDQEHRF